MEFGADGGRGDLTRGGDWSARWTQHLDASASRSASRERIRDLPVETQQAVEIARALVTDAKVLILDEPTAVLSPSGIEKLFERLKVMQAGGVTIILILHKIREVLAIADTVTVLRGGRLVEGPDADRRHRRRRASPRRSSARRCELNAVRRRPRRRWSARREEGGKTDAAPAAAAKAAPILELRERLARGPIPRGRRFTTSRSASAAARSSASPASRATASGRWSAPSRTSPTSIGGDIVLDGDRRDAPPAQRAPRVAACG